MRRVCGETIDEMLRVARRWPEATRINLPPRTKDAWKSKSLPTLLIDAEREDILEAIGSVEVSQDHIRLMTMMLREDFFRTRCGRYWTEEVGRFFEREVRGKLSQLLRAGSWVDEPENLSLQNWNKRVEKFDLGRRKDLKFSKDQDWDSLKYNQDKNPQPKAVKAYLSDPNVFDDLPDFEIWYRDGSTEQRMEIIRSRPWMKSLLQEKYGEP